MGVGKITRLIVREVIEKIVVRGEMGNKTYLIKDKEAYIVEKSEIYGAHGIPIDIHTFTEELQQVLHDVGGRIIVATVTFVTVRACLCANCGLILLIMIQFPTSWSTCCSLLVKVSIFIGSPYSLSIYDVATMYAYLSLRR